jgi:hypothetical protein
MYKSSLACAVNFEFCSKRRIKFRKIEKPRRLLAQTTAKARRRLASRRLCCFPIFRIRRLPSVSPWETVGRFEESLLN